MTDSTEQTETEVTNSAGDRAEVALLCGGDWTKRGPTEPGEYYMTDEGGGPTLYVCEIIDGELKCGPKSRRIRISVDALRMESTEWRRAT